MNSEQKSEQRAILIHACGLDEVNPEKPDTVARQSALAAAELLRRDKENTYLVITAGEYSPGGPDLGEVLANHIRTLFNGDPDISSHIITTHTARDTRAEVRDFQEVARNHNWQHLYDLGPQSQHKRRERAVKALLKGQIPTENVLNAETVLLESNETRYKPAVESVQNSPKYQDYAKMNKRLDVIGSLPFGDKVLDIVSKVVSNRLKNRFTTSSANSQEAQHKN